ncbi:MAG: glycosyltransferase family A protein [Patescibacteria group bacterium]
MISIIIPLYNQADKLPLCLDSLLRQTYKNIEVIVVNDGSTDKYKDIISKYQKILREKEVPFYYFDQSNKGAPAARNKGFEKAGGEYLLFCDADACLYPQFLEITKEELDKNPDISFVYSSFMWGKKKFTPGPFSRKKLQKMPYIHTMSLIRRKDYPPAGWDEAITKLQDWDLWLTMAERGKKGKWVEKTLFKVAPGGTISSWLPSFAYKLLPFLPQVKKYKRAEKIIKRKHMLES